MQALARLVGCSEHAECRAKFGRGQRPRVAMGQDPLAVTQQRRPVPTDRMARLPVLLVDRAGLIEQRRNYLFRGQPFRL